LRKKIRTGTLLVLVLIGGLALLLDWSVTRLAMAGAPGRWRHIPLQQDSVTAINYFGTPAEKGRDFLGWQSGSKSQSYTMRLYYGRNNRATAYSMHYTYRNRLITRSYLLDSLSLE
jgi:hypothetical protein